MPVLSLCRPSVSRMRTSPREELIEMRGIGMMSIECVKCLCDDGVLQIQIWLQKLRSIREKNVKVLDLGAVLVRRLISLLHIPSLIVIPSARYHRFPARTSFSFAVEVTMHLTYPCCIGTFHWHIPHIQRCFCFIGTRGTKHNSNQVRDLAWITDAICRVKKGKIL